jgi:hypothetical protein
MPFPANIDFDKLVNIALHDVGGALHDWLSGRPHDEVAFMNHVTGLLGRRRRGCDVGVATPVRVTARIAMLHRQSENQVDRFGSDLAITIFDDQTAYAKTALFQIKKSQDYSLTVQRTQLKDALADHRIGQRSFILAIDESRAGVRIAKTQDIHAKFDSTQHTLTDNCADWSFLTNWLWRWMSCEEGLPSDTTDPNSVEALLDHFIIEAEEWVSPWRTNPNIEVQGEYPPARVWLAFFFEHESR